MAKNNDGPKALKDLLRFDAPKRKRKKVTVALEIVDGETGRVIRTVDVRGKTPGQIEKIDRGLYGQMDVNRYFTRPVEE